MWVDSADNFHVVSHVYRMGPDAKICTAGHNGSIVSGHYFSQDGPSFIFVLCLVLCSVHS